VKKRYRIDSGYPILHPHAEVENPSAQNMVAKLELFQHKPEINIQESYT